MAKESCILPQRKGEIIVFNRHRQTNKTKTTDNYLGVRIIKQFKIQFCMKKNETGMLSGIKSLPKLLMLISMFRCFHSNFVDKFGIYYLYTRNALSIPDDKKSQLLSVQPYCSVKM